MVVYLYTKINGKIVKKAIWINEKQTGVIKMSRETKKLDKWFSEHFEISFVGGDKKENKKLGKKITKKLKDDIIKGDK